MEFGKRVQYRNTDYELEAVLQKGGDAELIILHKGKEVCRGISGLPGQYAVLDVDAPMPVIECWGDRFDGLATRILQRVLIHPKRGHEVALEYIEIYTPDEKLARAAEPHQVSRRPSKPAKTFYFYGYHTGHSPAKADSSISKAKAVSGSRVE